MQQRVSGITLESGNMQVILRVRLLIQQFLAYSAISVVCSQKWNICILHLQVKYWEVFFFTRYWAMLRELVAWGSALHHQQPVCSFFAPPCCGLLQGSHPAIDDKRILKKISLTRGKRLEYQMIDSRLTVGDSFLIMYVWFPFHAVQNEHRVFNIGHVRFFSAILDDIYPGLFVCLSR